MISEEYEEEYYVKNNQELQQVELRFFSKKDRLVFAQKYDDTTEYTFEEAKELCENIKCSLEIEDLNEELESNYEF